GDFVARIGRRIPGRELQPDRIAVAEIPLHEGAVDERDRARAPAIGGPEIAPLQQLRAGRPEVAGADEALPCADGVRRIDALAVERGNPRALEGVLAWEGRGRAHAES